MIIVVFQLKGRELLGQKEVALHSWVILGELEQVDEERLEFFFNNEDENRLLDVMHQNHPYEQVAFQVYSLDNVSSEIGSGMIGELQKEIEPKEYLDLLKSKMSTECIRHTKLINKKIKKIAICGGSGSFLLEEAKKQNADLFVSSDFKYHEFFDAEDEIIIADIGHFESEQFTKDLIYDLLSKKFTKFAVQLSKVNTNPINYL
jgi:putative NIF3 family GTP cyclohydrolase 1 type 2